MLRCVARFVDRAACNGEAAPMIARLRSSGLALGLRRRRRLSLLQGRKYHVLLSSKVLLTVIPASNCLLSTCGRSDAAASIISGSSYLRWYRRRLGLAHVSSDTEP
jgi:hypothetical protein